MKLKVYLFCEETISISRTTLFVGGAVDENGKVIANHISSNKDFLRSDLIKSLNSKEYTIVDLI